MGVLVRKSRLDKMSLSKYFDSETGVSSIELYNATKDPFRVAPSGKIPIPWPYDHEMASVKAKKMETELLEMATETLRRYNIVPSYIHVLNMSKRGLPSTAKDTIVVSINDDDTTRWLPAADEIYQTILPRATEAGIQFRVELRNQERMYTDMSAALRQSKETLDVLLSMDPLIMATEAYIFWANC
ncbi:hypothetical protein V492_00791 [Pseudogymnoascus sp. VKM F-4246]|nr:hypothetical protein V492_00791 [Pseudogymnoascus sp. VKM F-4246]